MCPGREGRCALGLPLEASLASPDLAPTPPSWCGLLRTRPRDKGASRGGRAPVRTVERWFGWTQELEERGWSGEPGTASLSLGRLKRRVICTGMGRVLPLDGVAAGWRDRSKVFL